MVETTFLQSLRGLHPHEVVVEIGDYYLDQLPTYNSTDEQYRFSMQVLALLTECARRRNLSWSVPDLSGSKRDYVSKAASFIQHLVNSFRHQLHDVSTTCRSLGDLLFGEEGLSESDIQEIQGLLLQLRQAVATSTDLSDQVKAEVIRNIEDIDKLLHEVGIDMRTVLGYVTTLWALTKEAKDLFEIVKIMAEITTQGLDKQIGLPVSQIAHKLLK